MEYGFVPGQLAHFSINADDLPVTQAFYSAVFGWKYHAYGPPGFYMVQTTPDGVTPAPMVGSVQGRRELVEGIRLNGFECTIAVDDIDSAILAIEANGGQIVMPKCTLPSIGHLCFFQDPGGNFVGAMQYDSNAE